MTRTIPKSLKDKQEEMKRNTINNIQEAIDTIQEEGGIVTKKKLIEYTGLSNATFSKPHVKQLLEINRVCQYRESKKITRTNNDIKQDIEVVNRLNKKIAMLESKVHDKEIVISKIKSEYEALNTNYELLLGKLHLVMRKVDEREYDIGIDFDNL